mgnify:FL=1|jgi:hypothetical protein
MEEQEELFGKEEHWDNMPEFLQEKQEDPFSTITVRFETEEDLNDFSQKIGQKLTPLSKSIWHPYKSHWGDEVNKLRWQDES